MYASDLKHPDPGIKDLLEQLYALNRNLKIDLSFRPPYVELLQKLGNPHLKLPPVIHVAGTNGKGSCIAFMRSILEAAGYRVHIYTSPHLQRFNERIVLAGQQITDAQLAPLITEIMELNGGRELTFFEATTALAFAAFSRTPADILLLEVGMGGRLDCTNIIESSCLSIIQPVSFDHQEYLGQTLEEIAKEKTGIMKLGVPIVVGPQPSEAMQVIRAVSDSAHIPIYAYNSAFFCEAHDTGMRFTMGGTVMDLPLPSLPGAHQVQNAGVALAALQILKSDFPVGAKAIYTGLQKTRWPARMQRLQGSLNRFMSAGWEIWLDGGHNESAGLAIASQMRTWAHRDDKDLHLILGMLGNKDAEGFYRPLRSYVKTAQAIPIPGEPAASNADALAKKLSIAPQRDLKSALQHINASAPRPGRVLITGSLYLAGHVLNMDAA